MTMTTPPTNARAVVAGAGAIGTVLGAHLWRTGVPVELFTKPAADADRANRDGILAEGVGGRVEAKPKVVSESAELTPKPDAVFRAMKAIPVKPALAELEPILAPHTAIVVMQNGYCEDMVSEIVGAERVISCTVKWGASLLGPGHSVRTSHGGFVLGTLSGATEDASAALLTVASMLRPAWPVLVTPNVQGIRHAKLIFNACATTLGAVCGLNLRGILSSRAGRRAFLRTATEGIDVFQAMGIKLEPLDKLPMTLLHTGPPRERGAFSFPLLVAEMVARLISWRRGSILSSMLQSLRRGEDPEIEYLNGYIVRKGRNVGVPTPFNERLCRVIGEIAAGIRPIEPRNLPRLFTQ
jgi:2-dehydropantoate 2-reductase